MSETDTILIRNGSLYINKELYESFFSGIDSVAFLPQESGFLILPVHSYASGGRLMKIRNAHGDRVVSAPDFFHEQGLGESEELRCQTSWDPEASALRVDIR